MEEDLWRFGSEVANVINFAHYQFWSSVSVLKDLKRGSMNCSLTVLVVLQCRTGMKL